MNHLIYKKSVYSDVKQTSVKSCSLGIEELNLLFSPLNFIPVLELLFKLKIWKQFSLSLRSEAPIFLRPLSQSLKTFHRWALRQQPVMEGPPVLTQSGDEKYPDMVKVLSAAQHCLVWEPQSSVTEKQIFLVPAWRFASNKTRTNQRPASVEVKWNTSNENRNNCDIWHRNANLRTELRNSMNIWVHCWSKLPHWPKFYCKSRLSSRSGTF